MNLHNADNNDGRNLKKFTVKGKVSPSIGRVISTMPVKDNIGASYIQLTSSYIMCGSNLLYASSDT